jgi:hypothetical protein
MFCASTTLQIAKRGAAIEDGEVQSTEKEVIQVDMYYHSTIPKQQEISPVNSAPRPRN